MPDFHSELFSMNMMIAVIQEKSFINSDFFYLQLRRYLFVYMELQYLGLLHSFTRIVIFSFCSLLVIFFQIFLLDMKLNVFDSLLQS